MYKSKSLSVFTSHFRRTCTSVCCCSKLLHEEVYIFIMPRKCCTVFDGESCRANYDETKNKSHKKVTGFETTRKRTLGKKFTKYYFVQNSETLAT